MSGRPCGNAWNPEKNGGPEPAFAEASTRIGPDRSGTDRRILRSRLGRTLPALRLKPARTRAGPSKTGGPTANAKGARAVRRGGLVQPEMGQCAKLQKRGPAGPRNEERGAPLVEMKRPRTIGAGHPRYGGRGSGRYIRGCRPLLQRAYKRRVVKIRIIMQIARTAPPLPAARRGRVARPPGTRAAPRVRRPGGSFGGAPGGALGAAAWRPRGNSGGSGGCAGGFGPPGGAPPRPSGGAVRDPTGPCGITQNRPEPPGTT